MSDQREGGIAWTDETWNPMRGCTRVSEGCRHCYAEIVAARFSDQPAYKGLAKRSPPRWTGEVRFVPEKLHEPLRWQRPRRVFVNSMSDVFHEKFSNEQIAAVFGVMAAAQRHTFQVLTKRPKRMLEWFEWVDQFETSPIEPPATVVCEIEAQNYGADAVVAGTTSWPLPNVWLGVSCEDVASTRARVPQLLKTPAAVRFVSAEPLLEDVGRELAIWCNTVEGLREAGLRAVPEFISYAEADAALERFVSDRGDVPPDAKVDWVIVGGESGNHARACDVAWIEEVVETCRVTKTACFVKQLGAKPFRSHQRMAFEQSAESIARHGEYDPDPIDLELTHTKGGDPSEWPEELRVQQFPEVRRGQR